MTQIARNKLFLILSVLGAALASMGACFSVFVASRQENLPIAAAAFAVAGFISIMPWQLAQACHADYWKDKTTHGNLIKAGAWMALATLLFVAGAMLRYFRFHSAEIVSLGDTLDGVLWLASVVFSGVAFLVASLYFMMGVMLFAWILVDMTHEEADVPAETTDNKRDGQ